MKRKYKRLWLVVSGLAAFSAVVAGALVFYQDSIIFFYSPTQIAADPPETGRRFRLGGLVEEGSVHREDDGVTIDFRVTDLSHVVPVRFRGFVPDLFAEGQGVVAEGAFDAAGVFVAAQVLAKHDENYMPADVTEALKKSGQWRGGKK